MRKGFGLLVFSALCAPLCSWAAAGDGGIAPADVVGEARLVVDTLRFERLDVPALLEEDRQRAARAELKRFAVAHEVIITPGNSGTIVPLEDGRVAWRVRLDSENGMSVNFGSEFAVPPSTRMWLLDGAGSVRVGPLTADLNRAHGQLWTPVVAGNVMEIHAEVDDAEWDVFEGGFAITSVNVGYRPLGGAMARELGLDREGAGERGIFATDSCLVDVACSQADPWPVQVDGVGLYTLEGTLRCSTALTNNTAEDQTPYLLTAHHCTPQLNPASLVLYWNMENSSCRPPYSAESGQIGDGQYDQYTLGGTTVVAMHIESDYVLLRMNSSPDPAFGVNFMGWDRSGNPPQSTFNISHPGVQEKRIMLDHDPAVEFSIDFPGFAVVQMWLTIADEGGVEGGSSGSPLFDQTSGLIVGVATWADPREPTPNYCPQQNIGYGRFAHFWVNEPAVGAALDPLGTGAATLAPLVPPPPCAGDVNGDGVTDVFDFGLLSSNFGKSVLPGFGGDLNGDGFVDVFDFAILAGDFGCGP